MLNGLVALALVCLVMPFVWFQWGQGWALMVALASPLLAGRRWLSGLLILTLALLLIARLEAEADHLLPAAWQHQQAELTVCLSQPPRLYDRYQRFDVRVLEQPPELELRRLRLTADTDIALDAGDCLSVRARLRQPAGRLIPGGFNVSRYYFSERLDGLGTVVEVRARHARPDVAARLYQRVRPQFTDQNALDVWAALALGWSTAMDADLAELFEQNQIKHLMVVSGMHIAMVAGWALLLARLVHRLPGPWRGHWLGVRLALVATVCGGFVALTGFGFPAVRAWLMLLAPLLALTLGGRLSGTQALALAAVAIALLRPQAWLSTGAWLSFGMVWVLIRLYQRWRSEALSGWRLALRFQLLLALLSLPIAAWFGFQWHPLSVLINLLVIPLVTLVILPWSLLILAWPPLAGWGYQTLLGWGVEALTRLATWHQPAPAWTLAAILLCAGLVWLGLTHWLNREQRWLLAPLAAALLVQPGRYHPPADFRMTVFDVGHGQALLLEWPDSVWLYDTAGQWSQGESIAAARLANWFSRRQLSLDGIIVSHSDIDHAGGAGWAVRRWPGAQRLSGEPEMVAGLSDSGAWHSCHHRPLVELPFRLLSPPPSLRDNDNNRSCLLSVATGAGRLVITGDAGRRLEYWLLQSHAELFPASLLVLGHHGSRTSSAPAFLDASPAATLVVSAGDRARPRWPNADLLEHLRRHGRPLFNTARYGTLELSVDQGRWRVRDWRSAFRRRFLTPPP